MDERDERFPDTLGSPGHVEGVEGGNISMSTFLGCYFLAPHGKDLFNALLFFSCISHEHFPNLSLLKLQPPFTLLCISLFKNRQFFALFGPSNV